MNKALIPIVTVSLMAGVSQSDAATIPYTNDFSGIGGNTAFTTETTDSQWTVASGVYSHTNTVTTGGGVASSASISITNAAATPFTLETQFVVSTTGTLQTAAQTLGFGLYGLTTAFSGTSAANAYYLADFAYAHGSSSGTEGVLRILALGDTSNFTHTDPTVDNNPGSSTLAVVLGTTYTLRLEATYVGSTLNMTLGLFDAAGTTQIGSSATASDTTPLTGTNFGYRNRSPISGGAVGIDFDNFSIVPEPATLALMGLGSLLMLGRRKA